MASVPPVVAPNPVVDPTVPLPVQPQPGKWTRAKNWGIRKITPAAEWGVRKLAPYVPVERMIGWAQGYTRFYPHQKLAEYEAEIIDLTGSNHAAVAAHVVANFVKDKLLIDKKDWIQNLIDENVGSGEKILAKVLNREDLIIQAVHLNLMKAFVNLFKRIKEKQANPQFLPNLFMSASQKTSLYFEKLQIITNGKEFQKLMEGKETISDEAEKYLREELSKHEGIDPIFANGMGIENIRTPQGEKERMQGIYQILSAALMDIALPSPQDLELPDLERIPEWVPHAKEIKGIRTKLYDELKGNILPTVLHTAFAESTSASSIDSILLSSLEKLNAPTPDKVNTETSPVINDNTLEIMKVTCGNLVKALSQMFPATLVKLLFNVPYAEEQTGEFLAKQILKFVTPPPLDADGNVPANSQYWHLIRMINTGIESGLDSFHPGQWRPIDADDLRKFKFQPQKVTWAIDPNDPLKGKQKKRIENEKDIKFSFADSFTPEGIAQRKKEKQWDDVVKSINLQKEMDKVLDKQVVDILPNIPIQAGDFILSIVKSLVKLALAITILPLFFWEDVTKRLDEISGILKAAAQAILVDILWRKTSLHEPWKWHLEKQRNQAVKVLHMPTHDVLFLTIADVFIKGLKKQAQAPVEAPASI